MSEQFSDSGGYGSPAVNRAARISAPIVHFFQDFSCYLVAGRLAAPKGAKNDEISKQTVSNRSNCLRDGFCRARAEGRGAINEPALAELVAGPVIGCSLAMDLRHSGNPRAIAMTEKGNPTRKMPSPAEDL